MCENLKPDRIRCDACRTINLAKAGTQPKPDMQMYEKCSPTKRLVCPPVAEFPVEPTCIKVCSKEEYNMRKAPKKVTKIPLPYAHGKLMYAVKAGILVGSVYFTYSQGVWGNQQDVTECIRRWQEYIRSINTRRPPVFDQCGKVWIYAYSSSFSAVSRKYKSNYLLDPRIMKYLAATQELGRIFLIERKESSESILAPAYAIYKYFVTTCFSGVVKVPLLIKCAYINYLKALERRRDELDKERKIRKTSKVT